MQWPWTDKNLEDFKILVDPVNAPQLIRKPEPQHFLLRDFLNPTSLEAVLRRPARTVLSDAVIKPITAIIGDAEALGDSTEERYQNYLAKVKQNPYCKWLLADERFRRAYNLFLKRQTTSKNPNYRVEWAELHFLYIAAAIGLYAKINKTGFRPRDPTTRQVAQALSRASALKESLDLGVRLESWSDTTRFSDLLDKLRGKLVWDRKQGYRKPRADATRMGRAFVANTSRVLLEVFGEASPDIVVNLARVVGYDADETAIERQIAGARRTYKRERARKVLTAALSTKPTKSA